MDTVKCVFTEKQIHFNITSKLIGFCECIFRIQICYKVIVGVF